MVTIKKTKLGLHVEVVNGAGVQVWNRIVTRKAIENREGIKELKVIKLGKES